MIDECHVKAFYEGNDGQEFREFSKSGIAAKISNLNSVYAMYLNTLDRQPAKKEKLQNLLAKHGPANDQEDEPVQDDTQQKANVADKSKQDKASVEESKEKRD